VSGENVSNNTIIVAQEAGAAVPGNIENIESKPVNIYPNPANSNITIENINSGNKNYLLRLINIEGQEVYSKEITFSNIYQLELSEFVNGVYSLILQNDKELISKRIILHK